MQTCLIRPASLYRSSQLTPIYLWVKFIVNSQFQLITITLDPSLNSQHRMCINTATLRSDVLPGCLLLLSAKLLSIFSTTPSKSAVSRVVFRCLLRKSTVDLRS